LEQISSPTSKIIYRKSEDLCSSTHNMGIPNDTHVEYTLINIDGDYLSLMLSDGNTKDDVKILEGDLGQKTIARFRS
jgi:translation initiation factor 5A